jgi:AraC-like DNA-binding protein
MDPRFETVQSDINSSFRCLHFRCRSFAEDHTWHYHPEYELTWVIRSEGTRFIGDSIRRYDYCDLVLVGPNLPHCWHNEPRFGNAEEPELIVAQFRGDCFGSDLLSLREAAPIRRLLELATCGIHFRGPVVSRVGELMRTMVEATGMNRLLRLIETLDALAGCQTYDTLASADYHHNNEINPVTRRRVEIVHQFVRDNLGGEICQAQIASALGLGPPAFSRFFRAATGQTFVGFVNLLRISEACRLLSDERLSVTVIAMECGYRNISNFNRQFLAVKGMNPSDYRERVRRLSAHAQDWPRLRAVS